MPRESFCDWWRHSGGREELEFWVKFTVTVKKLIFYLNVNQLESWKCDLFTGRRVTKESPTELAYERAMGERETDRQTETETESES